MRRSLALLWLVAVLGMIGGLGLALRHGIALDTNILALLPRGEQDAAVQRAEDRIAGQFSRRVVLLLGHSNADTARAAAASLIPALEALPEISHVTGRIDAGQQRELAALYFPYRQGLLAEADRRRLMAQQGQALVQRAEALLYGPGAGTDAKLLGHDPFFLLPAFFAGLPLPQSRLNPEDGFLMAEEAGQHYVFLSLDLAGDAYDAAVQDAFVPALDQLLAGLRAAHPGLLSLRAGAVFYARDGGHQAESETSTIGLASLLGTLILVLAVFRAVRPLLLTALAILIGIGFALAGALLIFHRVHAVALLFGVSLIGISVDYSLQYFCEYFDPAAKTPDLRLKLVLPGVAIGLSTTLIGYLTLLLAPFPGLRQVAALSGIGLTASFLTVALWYPLLDRKDPPGLGQNGPGLVRRHWAFWQNPLARRLRAGLCLGLIGLALLGGLRVQADDDIRHLETLSPDLRAQEQHVTALAGGGGGQFLLVQAADAEAALQREEALFARLDPAKQAGLLTEYHAPAQFVPSQQRQQANRALLRDALYQPFLAGYLAAVGYGGAVDPVWPTAPLLTPALLPSQGVLALVQAMIVDRPDPGAAGVAHLVLLDGVKDPGALRALLADEPGIRLISPAADISALFGLYRRAALGLLALSALLMLPLMIWRYGWGNGVRVLAPSVVSVVLTPPLAALFGIHFTFFNAMALVLVLSIGVDYSVFCRESGARKNVTLYAVWLAALSTLLSFGLLAFSQVFAVHAFGVTMLIGIALAALLAPAAGEGKAG